MSNSQEVDWSDRMWPSLEQMVSSDSRSKSKLKKAARNVTMEEFASPSTSPPVNGYHDTMHQHISNGHTTSESSVLPTENSTAAPVESRIDSAETAEKEIEQDKREAQHVIAHHGIDPVALLHMVERWTQIVLGEFKDQKNSLRRSLKEKWEKNELQINAEHNDRSRKLFEQVRKLEKALEEGLSKKSFESLRMDVSKVDQNTSPKELKGKVTNLIEQYTSILDSLEFLEKSWRSTQSSSFTPAKHVLERIQAQNNKSCHSICIIGLEKCGKSTFNNALVGYELLPAASERCTQIRTVLKPLLPNDATLLATVEFYDDATFEMLIEKMTPKSDEQDRDFQSRIARVRQERQRLINKYPNRRESFTVNGTLHDGDNQRNSIIQGLHKYIADELYVNIIKDIAIYTDKLPGKNYEISDVPGFDSPIKEHRMAGLQAIQSADAFLFLTDGNRPSLTRDQIRLLNEIQDGNQHYEAMKRAFGVITKLDHCHTSSEYHDRFRKAKEELMNKGFREDHIFPVCSVMNLLNPNSDTFQAISQKIKNFGDLQNGFQNCKRTLNQFIECELPQTHLNQLIDFGCTKLCRYVNECLTNAKKDPALCAGLQDDASYEQYLRDTNSQKWDQIFEDEVFEPAFAEANIWQKQVLQKERGKFIANVKKLFHDRLMESTKNFLDRQVNIDELMMRRYGFTALHATTQVVDDQIREKLSFDLQDIVIETTNVLSRYLYDEYVCHLEMILNKISPQNSDYLYHSEKVSYDICSHEIRAVVLRVCRPIITATLRFSHSDQRTRRCAVDELILIVPTIACHLCESNDQTEGGITAQIKSWTPTLKQGIETALQLYGKTGVQNKIASMAFQFALKKMF